jgi:hypothetical protein
VATKDAPSTESWSKTRQHTLYSENRALPVIKITLACVAWGGQPLAVTRCTDYKGELLGNPQYCYPLTVTDHASRFLLTCDALSSTCEDYAFTVLERPSKERGLPASIRSDNGVPFASPHALFNLSKLAVWWLRDRH